MKENGASEKHMTNELQTVLYYAIFLGPNTCLLDINKRDQILTFLNTKQKDENVDPSKRWNTTWNDYYKTTTAANGKKGEEKNANTVPIKPEDIDITEYKKMLFATLKDALEIMGFGDTKSIESSIFNIRTSSSFKRMRGDQFG
jgi:hypothetical protein